MAHQKFAADLLAQLAEKTEWGLSPDHVTYYEDGFSSKDDAELLDFIHNTNLHYHKSESDILIGNFLVIRQKMSNDIWSMCRFDADYLQWKFEEGGWEAVWQVIQPQLESSARITENGILSSINDYEAIKERLIIRPLNYNYHRRELKHCIYRRTGDIALVLYLIFSYDKEYGLNTSKIQQATFQNWDRAEAEVWENALMNTYVLAPPRLYANPMDAGSASYTKGAFMAAGSNISLHPLQVPLVTTTQQINGAIALFYPGVKERLAQVMGGSFYAAFISIHECMIHRCGTITPRQVQRHLSDVNNAFSQEENLTRKVFYYDVESGEFAPID